MNTTEQVWNNATIIEISTIQDALTISLHPGVSICTLCK